MEKRRNRPKLTLRHKKYNLRDCTHVSEFTSIENKNNSVLCSQFVTIYSSIDILVCSLGRKCKQDSHHDASIHYDHTPCNLLHFAIQISSCRLQDWFYERRMESSRISEHCHIE